ncbi:Uncharacterised protein [Mycobacterium xenopi]|nr:Uncharacterised protein [Mycobacterium xenopi]
MRGLSSTLTGMARRSSPAVAALNRPTATQEAIQLKHATACELVNTYTVKRLSPYVCQKVK